MVGKITFPDGTVKVDWSTHKKEKRVQAFRDALLRRQNEVRSLFKIGTKVIASRPFIEIYFANKEIAAKVGNTDTLIKDEETGSFFSIRLKTLTELFNSGHEFIVVGYNTESSELILTQDINFFTDDFDWDEFLKNKTCICLEIKPVKDDVSSITKDETIYVFDDYVQFKQV